MRTFFLAFAAAVVVSLAGCGGGGVGSGGGIRVDGRVLSVTTGGPPNPQATAQIGSASSLTGAEDGVFVLNVASGSSQLVVTHPTFPTFVFDFPPVTADTSLGDFWIGPETVNIQGRVVNSQDSSPIEGALVQFAGKRAVTGSDGSFLLTGVAYDSQNDFVFIGIFGTASKSGFLTAQFNVVNQPVNGVITVADILLAPESDPNPPGPPYNLWGIVTVQGGSPVGVIATLLQGGSPVRVFNVGANGRYQFWAVPGSYTIRFEKSGFQTVEIPIVGFDSPDDVIRNDVTLVPQ
ncbi:MAG: hypothetical protein KatS3mg015_0818 [Fimbriimonadales bacterium]|nr:MAG: hypothetical protein KatS3mg015_0818 [Fimbriimonadales bacterium]